MNILKDQHEAFARFFASPTRDELRKLLQANIGEADHLDFKAEWPTLPKLGRHVLALANSGGGALVIGISQTASGQMEPTGLTKIKDKAELVPPLRMYLPRSLEFHVIDFTYSAAEYEALVGKSFQVLIVEDLPKELPFLSLKEADGLRTSVVYVRDGTTSTEAGQDQVQRVLNRRIESGHSNQPSLDLKKHLAQLRTLDEYREGNDSWVGQFLHQNSDRFDDTESHDFRAFIEDAYEAKKQAIWKVLGL